MIGVQLQTMEAQRGHVAGGTTWHCAAAFLESVMPTAWAYIRETAQQSTDDQWAAIVDYSDRVLEPRGIQLEECYFDLPASARHENFLGRSRSWECIAECQPGDCIVVVSLGNAFRNHDDFIAAEAALTDRGIELHIAGGASSESILDPRIRAELLTVLAVAEKERASETAKERYAECRRQGKAIGRAPLGMKWAGPRGHRRLVPDRHDRAIMQSIRNAAEAGGSLDEIFWILLCRGVRRSSGREWGRTTIWTVLQTADGALES
jgi:DNA invertase Pin-like site-specific DNA recombinase